MTSHGRWKKNDLQRTELGQEVARASPKKVNRLDLMGTFLDREPTRGSSQFDLMEECGQSIRI